MKIDEILALAKAGFTADQIAQMSAAEAQPQKAPEQAPVPQPQPTPEPQKTPEPLPQPAPNPMDALMQQIANLTNVVQANALGATQMPEKENADDILASIINPPEKK